MRIGLAVRVGVKLCLTRVLLLRAEYGGNMLSFAHGHDQGNGLLGKNFGVQRAEDACGVSVVGVGIEDFHVIFAPGENTHFAPCEIRLHVAAVELAGQSHKPLLAGVHVRDGENHDGVNQIVQACAGLSACKAPVADLEPRERDRLTGNRPHQQA